MEQVIEKLLQNFEQGTMTRRQLVQSLAVAATAAAAAATASPASAAGAGLKASAVHHISYQVSDYTKIRDFYASLLGMKVLHDDPKRNQCRLSFGGSYSMVVRTLPPKASLKVPHIDHMAYVIDDWDSASVEAELKGRGLELLANGENNFKDDEGNAWQGFHVKDPDGLDLQLNGRAKK